MIAFALLSAPTLCRGSQATRTVWIGSCKPGDNANGIYKATFDTENGTLSQPELAAKMPRPSFFTTMRSRSGDDVLYAVNELSEGNGAVSALRFTRNGLQLLNRVSSRSDGPCFIVGRSATKTLYTANYHGETVSVFAVENDGSIKPPMQVLDFNSSPLFGSAGPDARQVKPHPHSILFSRNGRFAIVNDLGNDSLDVFTTDATGRLSTIPHQRVSTPPASGPRHLVFHPHKPLLYVLCELDSSLRSFAWYEATGKLTPTGMSLSSISPQSRIKHAVNAAAEIALSPDARFLYASNRGDDSISVFKLDRQGQPGFLQSVHSGGKTPRHFVIDPSGRWILCSNGGSDCMTTFRRSATTGLLEGPIHRLAITCPMYALFR